MTLINSYINSKKLVLLPVGASKKYFSKIRVPHEEKLICIPFRFDQFESWKKLSTRLRMYNIFLKCQVCAQIRMTDRPLFNWLKREIYDSYLLVFC